jgi:hypothetical protein
MAKMAAKAKQTREQQAEQQQKWAEAQKHAEQQQQKPREEAATMVEEMRRQRAERRAAKAAASDEGASWRAKVLQQVRQHLKTRQPKTLKRTREEEEEEAGTPSVSENVAKLTEPPQAQAPHRKKRVRFAEEVAVIPAVVPSPTRKKPSPAERVRRHREEERRKRAVLYFDIAFAGLWAAACGVAYLAIVQDRQQ